MNLIQVLSQSPRYRVALDAWSRNFDYETYIGYSMKAALHLPIESSTLSRKEYEVLCTILFNKMQKDIG